MRKFWPGVAVTMVAAALSTSPVLAAGPDVVIDSNVVFGGFYPDTPSMDIFTNLSGNISGLGTAGGRPVTFAGFFMDVDENDGVPGADTPGEYNNTIVQLNGAWNAGATPFVNLFPDHLWNHPTTSAQIAAGARDADIAQWAGYVNRWLKGEVHKARPGFAPTPGRSLFIAPLPEANFGSGFGYMCDPANYKLAFARMVDIILANIDDDAKVRFVFAPNGYSGCGGNIASYYPGAAWVDLFAFSAYNQHGYSGPDITASAAFLAPANDLRALDPTKPQLIAQTAACSSNPTRARFIADAFGFAKADPNLVGVIVFNQNKECDWRVWDGSTVLNSGWSTGMAGASYSFPLSAWFQGGALKVGLPPADPNPCPATNKTCDSMGFVDGGAQYHLYATAYRDAARNSFYFGNPGDVQFTGDWDCNGTETPGAYRQSDGYVYLRNSNSQGIGEIKFFFGNPGDVPIIGDFNGDRCDTVGIYRPANQTFYIINKLGANDGQLGAAEYSYVFGNPGDKPFTGDFDGDRVDTVGLHRESSGYVYFRNTHTQSNADSQFFFGDPGDKFVAGDWDGDGVDTPAMYRKSTGQFFIRNSNTQGNADVTIFVGSSFEVPVVAPRVG